MSTSDGGEAVCQEGHLDGTGYQRENLFSPAVLKPLTLEQGDFAPLLICPPIIHAKSLALSLCCIHGT